jgi:hypothetical protein
MLFLRIELNFNCDLHFIGELKNFEHMIISLENLRLVPYFWQMRFHMVHFEFTLSTLAHCLGGMTCETNCVYFQC